MFPPPFKFRFFKALSRSIIFRWACRFAMTAGLAVSAQDSQNASYRIAGRVSLPDDGCRQAVVVLCDSVSGQPLCRTSAQPFMTRFENSKEALDWIVAQPDATGQFEFTNLPVGQYIVVAQAWSGQVSTTNILPLYQSSGARGEVIHLLGRIEVKLPSPLAAALEIFPPGTNTVSFDQQFGNDDGLLLLGTRPQRGDPVLAWNGWGPDFIRHLIGFNLMPRGRTTVHALPGEAYASIFMNDNSPGFGTMALHFGESHPLKMPIVAGWSDGYKKPPANLVWLVELLQTNSIRLDTLLDATNRPPLDAGFWQIQRFQAGFISSHWEQEIILPAGQKTTVAEFLTAQGYARLNPRRE